MIVKRSIYVILIALIHQALLSVSNDIPRADWRAVEEKAQNTVVQIFTSRVEFNWLEPYRAPEQKQSAGSGFFINDQGYILTNYHVVGQATSLQIAIQSFGKKPLDVTIIGVCPDLDVALLKLTDESYALIKAKLGKIPYLELGNSDELYPPQEVLALGYPLGFRYLKSTLGVIAGREYLNGMCYLHITAPINPGNSGGPLLTLQAKVVGINTAGIAMAQNINYIVPINDILTVLKDLYKQSLVRRPTVGIGVNHATDEHAKHLGNPVPGGIYINKVRKGSMAQKVGIKEGDMLYEVECNGVKYNVDEYGDVFVSWRGSSKISIAELLMRCSSGAKIKATLYRQGKRLEVEGTFEIPDLSPIRMIYPEYEHQEIDYEMIGGAVIMQLRANHLFYLKSPLLKNHLFSNHNKNLLIITHLIPGSQMALVDCFYPSAVIDKVNGEKVRTLKQLREALLKSIKTENIALSIKGNQSSVLSLKKVLQDEKRLSYVYRYPITDIVNELIKKTNY